MIKPTLVYWCNECEAWLPLEDGSACPGDHDDWSPEHPTRPLHFVKRMRKRRMYICERCVNDLGEETAWFDREAFLEHLGLHKEFEDFAAGAALQRQALGL